MSPAEFLGWYQLAVLAVIAAIVIVECIASGKRKGKQ